MKQEESVSERVSKELENDLYYLQAIRLGIANYSAIAEKLSGKVKGSREALKVAVVRFASRNEDSSIKLELEASKVLSNTKVSLENGVSVVVAESNALSKNSLKELGGRGVKSVVSSSNSITIVCDDSTSQEIEKILKGNVLKKKQGLCMIQLSSPESIETTPGVVSFVMSTLARRGINALETFSCYTDTLIVLERKDVVKAFEAIEEACGKKSLH